MNKLKRNRKLKQNWKQHTWKDFKGEPNKTGKKKN